MSNSIKYYSARTTSHQVTGSLSRSGAISMLLLINRIMLISIKKLPLKKWRIQLTVVIRRGLLNVDNTTINEAPVGVLLVWHSTG